MALRSKVYKGWLVCCLFFMTAFMLLCPATGWTADVNLESMLDDDFDNDEEVVAVIADPLEPVNRVFFKFNDSLYFWLVKPVGKVYSALLAEDVRLCIRDAFHNVLAPVRVVNHLLQGEVVASAKELSRFVINTTLGAGGLGDPAVEFGLTRKDADFGQTLGKYGLGNGFYVCWPLLGPSSGRDSIGIAGDYLLSPIGYGLRGHVKTSAGLSAVKYENEGTLRGEQYETIIREAFDPYVSVRDIYVQYRQGVVGRCSESK